MTDGSCFYRSLTVCITLTLYTSLPFTKLSLSLSLSLSHTHTHTQGFSAPSYDDKLVEVVGITGITQVTTARMLGFQKHSQRIAQCRYAKITMRGPDPLPMQVDGEAWLQEPGIIVVSHKNKARMIFKDKVRSCAWHVYIHNLIPHVHSHILPYSHTAIPTYRYSHTPWRCGSRRTRVPVPVFSVCHAQWG